MVAYKGTITGKLRPYIQNKGLRSSATTSYCTKGPQHSLTFKRKSKHILEDNLLGAKVVSILYCATVVFYDNLFTSFNLVKTLHTNLGLRSVPSGQIAQVIHFQ